MSTPTVGVGAEVTGGFGVAPAPGPALPNAIVQAVGGPSWPGVRLGVELAVLYIAAGAAFLAAPRTESGGGGWLAVLFPLLVLTLLHARRDSAEQLQDSLVGTTARVVGVVSVSSMLAISALTISGAPHPVGLAVRLWLFATVYLAIARAVLLSIRRHAVLEGLLATPTLIVGAGQVGEQLVKRLQSDLRYGLRPVGFIDADPLGLTGSAGSSSLPVLGGLDSFVDAIRRTGASHVILAFSSKPDYELLKNVRECQRMGVTVSLVPRLFEAVNDRASLDHVGGVPLLLLRPTDPHDWRFALKHGLDWVLALGALLVLSPVLLVVTCLVRASSPGPVLFRQRRVGRDGRVFDLLKFRTMLEPSSAQAFVPPAGLGPGGVEGIDRRTRVGRVMRKYSLDELPQLINVLRGEMSLVGPRPERPEFVSQFTAEVNRYDDRHRVKSGITGWAQVHGLRGRTSIADRVEWDNYYIQNWSLWLDFRILTLTVLELLRFDESG